MVALLVLLAVVSAHPGQPVFETPKVWTTMANCPHLPRPFRRWCVQQLTVRHARPGMSLAAFARLLDDPTWLTEECCCFNNVAFCGYIPVDITHDSTTFSLRVLPEADDSCPGAIYVRFSGKIDRRYWSDVLRGRATGRERDSTVLEVVASFD